MDSMWQWLVSHWYVLAIPADIFFMLMVRLTRPLAALHALLVVVVLGGMLALTQADAPWVNQVMAAPQNWLHWLLIGLYGLMVLILPLSRKVATTYARISFLSLVGLVMLLPFVWLVCAVFKDPGVLNQYAFLPPPSEISAKTVNLENYRVLFADKETVQGPVNFWRYLSNSLFLAAGTTFLGLVFCSMGGYALAKYNFPGRNAVLIFMLASLTIPGVVLLAPNFKIIWWLGWMDTYRALIIPASATAFGIFLFRQALLSIPNDLVEAGRIDGCGEFRIYLSLAMPLVRPMTSAFCLITFLTIWNSFLAPNIFLQSQAKLPLPVVLNQYITEYQQQYGVFLAGTLIAIIPPAILFFALQKEFIAGLTSGAVKQ